MELLTIGGGIQTIQEWIVLLGIPESFAPLLTAAVCVITAPLVSVGVMAVIWRYRKTLLRGRDLKLDRFTAPGFPAVSLFNALRIPVPSFSFDLSGMKGVATSLGVVGIAFALAFTFVVVHELERVKQARLIVGRKDYESVLVSVNQVVGLHAIAKHVNADVPSHRT